MWEFQASRENGKLIYNPCQLKTHEYWQHFEEISNFPHMQQAESGLNASRRQPLLQYLPDYKRNVVQPVSRFQQSFISTGKFKRISPEFFKMLQEHDRKQESFRGKHIKEKMPNPSLIKIPSALDLLEPQFGAYLRYITENERFDIDGIDSNKIVDAPDINGEVCDIDSNQIVYLLKNLYAGGVLTKDQVKLLANMVQCLGEFDHASLVYFLHFLHTKGALPMAVIDYLQRLLLHLDDVPPNQSKTIFRELENAKRYDIANETDFGKRRSSELGGNENFTGSKNRDGVVDGKKRTGKIDSIENGLKSVGAQKHRSRRYSVTMNAKGNQKRANRINTGKTCVDGMGAGDMSADEMGAYKMSSTGIDNSRKDVSALDSKGGIGVDGISISTKDSGRMRAYGMGAETMGRAKLAGQQSKRGTHDYLMDSGESASGNMVDDKTDAKMHVKEKSFYFIQQTQGNSYNNEPLNKPISPIRIKELSGTTGSCNSIFSQSLSNYNWIGLSRTSQSTSSNRKAIGDDIDDEVGTVSKRHTQQMTSSLRGRLQRGYWEPWDVDNFHTDLQNFRRLSTAARDRRIIRQLTTNPITFKFRGGMEKYEAEKLKRNITRSQIDWIKMENDRLVAEARENPIRPRSYGF